jgi:hypothetical protein
VRIRDHHARGEDGPRDGFARQAEQAAQAQSEPERRASEQS